MADNTEVYAILGACTALSGVASYLFFKFSRRHHEIARKIRDMKVAHPDAELENLLRQQDSHCLDYSVVEGKVKELGETLRSRHGNREGVVMRSQIVEHKFQFDKNGRWVKSKRTIMDKLKTVPFAIVGSSKDDLKYRVEVTKPDKALSLLNELETTSDVFELNKNPLRVFDSLGEFTYGFQITEYMLPTGVSILGVGKILLVHGQMKLAPPDTPMTSYVLTRMGQFELAQHYEAQSKECKVMAVIAAGIGISLAIFGLCHSILSWYERYQQRSAFEKIRRRLAEQRRMLARDQLGPRTDNICVVCLYNVSEVISLPCGHFNMCVSCAEALLTPKRCPVCREHIEQFIPMYAELD